MIDGSAILDRAVISTLISKLAQEQQELVTSLTKTETSSSSSSSDYRTWLRILSEMENEKTVLQELLKKAEKNEPGNSKAETDAAQLALHEARETHRILSVVHEICKSLAVFKEGFGTELHTNSARTLVDLKRILRDLGKEERNGLKVVSTLKARRTELQSVLVIQVEREWKDLIDVNSTGINLKEDADFPIRLKDLIETAKCLQTFPVLTKILAECIFRQIILPLAQGGVTCTICNDGGKSVLQIKNQSNNHSKDAIMNSQETSTATRLAEIRKVFQFLQTTVFIMDDISNFELASSLGSEINRDFVEAVRTKCIIQSLPTDFAEFESVKVGIVEGMAELRKVLLALKWISLSTDDWDVDTEVLEGLYAAKCGGELLILTRQLFISEKDFLDMRRIKRNEKAESEGNEDFALFRLQEMSVSSSVFTVTEQCRALLEWTSSSYSSMRSAISAIYCACSMMLDVVPHCFQKRLISVPSVGALYFTSCIYASHQLGIYNRMVQKSSVGLVESQANWNVCFVDLALKLRIKAYETLKAMTILFSKEVLETVTNGQTAWLTKLAQNHLQNLLDQSILKRGLDVLRRLATTWRRIFPPVVFQQAIGVMIDAVLIDAANRVIAVEDINASDSNTLCENFRWLLTQSTDLLTVDEVSTESAPFKHVASWMRFKEIMFVLDASMNQIAERWADHSGPLAEHLLPEEVKKMIRALFENNEKRAKLLASIK